MDFHSFNLLVIFLLLCSRVRAEATGSVFFVDSSTQQFLRSLSSNDVDKADSMMPMEVGAAVSVLLGFTPPSTVSAASSSKLNEVLMPNPFHRPRAVFMLEVRGINDPSLVDKSNSILSSAHSRKIVFNSKEAEIQLPDEDKVAVVSLDEQLADCTDKDIADFASWVGGSYVADMMKPLNGELTIPLGSGANVKFHMSKKADREFTVSLLSLIRNFRMAIEMHEDLSQGTQNPAELLTGCYDGIKVLQEQYGAEGIAQHGEELLLITLTKIYDTLQDAYKGHLVGIISFYRLSSPESSKMLNVKFVPRPSARWLEETKPSHDSLQEVVLVRRTLAWITGIILIIATLLGVYFLVNMPLTRDTLLYSSVKLD
ncbi:hypothetical protein FNV43_RR02322 [Rhamnella rubrinervis]|uniref:DUF7794 domain-containing protein n=1 Tax=Rhamnella rubrinervis TaxID=2594499 RepID=A0A8K0HTL2_9ROSA|nr:hypothetical protein FNV43_RR02322 [Rhamnella rubrinervis]